MNQLFQSDWDRTMLTVTNEIKSYLVFTLNNREKNEFNTDDIYWKKKIVLVLRSITLLMSFILLQPTKEGFSSCVFYFASPSNYLQFFMHLMNYDRNVRV